MEGKQTRVFGAPSKHLNPRISLKVALVCRQGLSETHGLSERLVPSIVQVDMTQEVPTPGVSGLGSVHRASGGLRQDWV